MLPGHRITQDTGNFIDVVIRFLCCGSADLFYIILDASEIAQAKLKGLDQTVPVASQKPLYGQNNQVKYAGRATSIHLLILNL